MKRLAKSSSESLINFPAELSVKAMGKATPDFQNLVESLVRPHLTPDAAVTVTTVPSSKGKYISVSVKFCASSQSQLEAIYRDLHANDRILFTM